MEEGTLPFPIIIAGAWILTIAVHAVHVRDVLSRFVLSVRRVATLLLKTFDGKDAKTTTGFDEAVRQSMVLRRQKLWRNMCHVGVLIDLLLCSCSLCPERTGFRPSVFQVCIMLTRWSVHLCGAWFCTFSDHIPIVCFTGISMLNCLAIREGGLHGFFFMSLAATSFAVLSPVAVPANAVVLVFSRAAHTSVKHDHVVEAGGEFATDAFAFIVICSFSWAVRCGILAEVKLNVKLKESLSSSRSETAALRSLLGCGFHAYAELDEETLIVLNESKLASLPVRLECNFEGTPFTDLIVGHDDKVAFEHAAHSKVQREEPDLAYNMGQAGGANVASSFMALRGAEGEHVPVEIFHCPFNRFSKTHLLVALRVAGRRKVAASETIQDMPGSATDRKGSQTLTVGDALASSQFSMVGLTMRFDGKFNIHSYVWPCTGEAPGCGESVLPFLSRDDGHNDAYFEAHHDCCNEMVYEALAVADTSGPVSMDFEATWTMRSRQWTAEDLRAKAHVLVSASTTTSAARGGFAANFGLTFEATIVDVRFFRVKPNAQSL